MDKTTNIWLAAAIAGVTMIAAAGCNGGGGGGGSTEPIRIDGSSTVYPITERVAESYTSVHESTRITAAFSGTGGGLKKFAAGEIDIADASRPIKEKEAEACAAAGISFTELEVAYDGLAVVVNPANSWCECLTVEQLKRLWEPGSTVATWKDLDPSWPNEKIELYGPGTDSGTFDYFTEAIVGEAKKSRADYTASEDDNVLVTGVSADRNALGYFGFAYFVENQDKLKLLGVDGGKGCLKPSLETVRDKSYAPLSRPLFIYVNHRSMERPEVRSFVEFYLDSAAEIAEQVGYIPAPEEAMSKNRQLFEQATAKEGAAK